ncbi:17845_t:CDS:2 [Cetraspora pellucida]|uniref:17845_t:CDS:1 n=1 Tax=Cetraspora pellucida TaxID=1433469 RepID=A0A9N9DTF3_9GLOM|nr:17845_t:CDS:2 [Cetraspora pellucida]
MSKCNKRSYFCKGCHIEHFVTGYDTDNEPALSDDDLPTNNHFDKGIFEFNPEMIIKSSLKDIKIINSAMNFLHIRERFLLKKFSSLNKINSINNFNNSPAYEEKVKLNAHLNLLHVTCEDISLNSLWLSVKHAVQLKILMHQIDNPFYINILENMCNKNLTEIQILALQSRILNNHKINSQEWKDNTFLITRNNLYVQLNFEVAKEHAYNNNQLIIHSCAQDFYNQRILTENNQLKFLSVSDIKENALCEILLLSINMKVILIVNICTNDKLANSTLELL